MPDIAQPITARARALLASWRAELHRSYVVHGVTPVTYGDTDVARDIAELDEVIAGLAAAAAADGEPVAASRIEHAYREGFTDAATFKDADTAWRLSTSAQIAAAPSAVAPQWQFRYGLKGDDWSEWEPCSPAVAAMARKAIVDGSRFEVRRAPGATPSAVASPSECDSLTDRGTPGGQEGETA